MGKQLFITAFCWALLACQILAVSEVFVSSMSGYSQSIFRITPTKENPTSGLQTNLFFEKESNNEKATFMKITSDYPLQTYKVNSMFYRIFYSTKLEQNKLYHYLITKSALTSDKLDFKFSGPYKNNITLPGNIVPNTMVEGFGGSFILCDLDYSTIPTFGSLMALKYDGYNVITPTYDGQKFDKFSALAVEKDTGSFVAVTGVNKLVYLNRDELYARAHPLHLNDKRTIFSIAVSLSSTASILQVYIGYRGELVLATYGRDCGDTMHLQPFCLLKEEPIFIRGDFPIQSVVVQKEFKKKEVIYLISNGNVVRISGSSGAEIGRFVDGSSTLMLIDESTCTIGCQQNGICHFGTCQCLNGFEGENCGCPSGCYQPYGSCSEYGKCECNPGFEGLTCNVTACPNQCTGHGNCYSGYCYCDSGYYGVDCSISGCPNNCTGHGYCENGTCLCWPGYSDIDCSSKGCLYSCSGHGSCFNGTCYCLDGWLGEFCEKSTIQNITCPNNCSGNGYCNFANGTCICNSGWTGNDCSYKLPTVEKACCVFKGEHGNFNFLNLCVDNGSQCPSVKYFENIARYPVTSCDTCNN